MDPNKEQPDSTVVSPNTSPSADVSAAPAAETVTPEHHDSTPPTPPKHKKHQGVRDFLSIVAVLASALLLAFALISFVFQSYQVDGQSMETTLQNNDHLLVWKVPRTIARITHHAYIPNRGDVVIFNEPGLTDFGGSGDKQLIKRVIGLPGDRVVVRNGVITIYNNEHPDGFQPDKTLPYNKDNIIPITTGNIDITLGKTQLYLCGDNRSNSLDSRVFGPVDANNIVGKLAIRVLPLGNVKKF
jgi:signal peptidase I